FAGGPDGRPGEAARARVEPVLSRAAAGEAAGPAIWPEARSPAAAAPRPPGLPWPEADAPPAFTAPPREWGSTAGAPAVRPLGGWPERGGEDAGPAGIAAPHAARPPPAASGGREWPEQDRSGRVWSNMHDPDSSWPGSPRQASRHPETW